MNKLEKNKKYADLIDNIGKEKIADLIEYITEVSRLDDLDMNAFSELLEVKQELAFMVLRLERISNDINNKLKYSNIYGNIF